MVQVATNTICFNCNKPIYKRNSHLIKYKLSFCNRECHNIYIKKQRFIVKCSACNKDVVLTGLRKRNTKSGMHFCNNICKNPFIAKIFGGKRKSKIDSKNHIKRKPRVIEAANGECQKCGYNEDIRMLDIHHNDGDSQNNTWPNFRCVCVWCHQKHHRCKTKLELKVLFDIDGNAIDLNAEKYISEKSNISDC